MKNNCRGGNAGVWKPLRALRYVRGSADSVPRHTGISRSRRAV